MIWKYYYYCNFTPAVAKITICLQKQLKLFMDQNDLVFFSCVLHVYDNLACVPSVLLNKNYNMKVKYLELSTILLAFSALQSPCAVYLQFLFCSEVVSDWQLTSN